MFKNNNKNDRLKETNFAGMGFEPTTYSLKVSNLYKSMGNEHTLRGGNTLRVSYVRLDERDINDSKLIPQVTASRPLSEQTEMVNYYETRISTF